MTAEAAPSHPLVPGYARFRTDKPKPNAQAGRLLLTELSCTACHHAAKKHGLHPKRGPDLTGVSSRVNQTWLRDFLLDPQKTKPRTTMPAMLGPFSPRRRAEIVESLMSFLASQRNSGKGTRQVKTASRGSPVRGKALFHSVGCIACHGSRELKEVVDSDDGRVKPGLLLKRDRVQSVPYPDLSQKYAPQTLARFLLNPLQARPSGRMPHIKLTRQEAMDIATYLSRGKVSAWTTKKSLVAQGKKLFGQLGCANCHSFKQTKPTKSYSPLAQLATSPHLLAPTSCIQPGRTARVPRFVLSKSQQQDLVTALQAFRTERRSPELKTDLALSQWNCYACHRRAGKGGVGARRYRFFETVNHVDLGDEGKVPPDLTKVGQKLTPRWLQRVLAGNGSVRPHMLARMPSFGPQVAADLATMITRSDDPIPTKSLIKKIYPGKAHVPSGRLFIGTGCVQCHAINGKRMPGVFGIDLSLAPQRLQPRWVRRFLLMPNRVRPRTRMPSFWLQGKSTNRIILGGDTESQLASIWAYLAVAKSQPLPPALQKKDTFELRPVTRPIVFRTFFKGAGTHAVAVGYPQELHAVFDSEKVRFAFFWRGRFLDAHGTWFNRFQPLTKPLGKAIVSLPPGPAFARLASADSKWPSATGEPAGLHMKGYKLNKFGSPTFVYRWNDVGVTDFVRPTSIANGLRRTVTLTSDHAQPANSWFRPLVHMKLTKVDRASVQTGSLTVRLSTRTGHVIRTQGQGKGKTSEWLVPLRFLKKGGRYVAEVDLVYQWK